MADACGRRWQGTLVEALAEDGVGETQRVRTVEEGAEGARREREARECAERAWREMVARGFAEDAGVES